MSYEIFLNKELIDDDAKREYIGIEIRNYICNSKNKDFMLSLTPVKSKRSIAQNKLYWKVLRLIKESAMGYGDGTFDSWSAEDFHEALSEKYLRDTNSNTGRVRTRSTSSLKIDEFSTYLDTIIKDILIATFNGSFSDERLYKDAMGISS